MSDKVNENPDDIIALKFPDDIRMVPSMYYGELDNADIALREIVDNSIDEMFKSTANSIEIRKLGNFHLVSDDGRGIPIKWDEEHQKTKADLAMSTTHAGSNFNTKKISTGKHGVGAAVCNALSTEFIIISKVTKDNYDTSIPKVKDEYLKRGKDIQLYYCVVYNIGVKKFEGCITIEEFNKELKFEWIPSFVPSTVVAFIPDSSIYDSIKITPPFTNLALAKLIFKKFYSRDLNIFLDSDNPLDYGVYKHELNIDIDSSKYSEINDLLRFYVSFEFSKEISPSFSRGSVNSLVINQGVHIVEMQSAIRDVICDMFGLSHVYKKYITMGLEMTSLVLLNKADFGGQTKEKLAKIPGYTADGYKTIYNAVYKLVKANKDEFEEHSNRIVEYVASITKLKNTDYIKSKITIAGSSNRSSASLPSKLFDSNGNNRKDHELFIVEGETSPSKSEMI